MERITRRWGYDHPGLTGRAVCEFHECPSGGDCRTCNHAKVNNRLVDYEDTGKLAVLIDGNKPAKIRFMPSAKVVRKTLRKQRVETAYADLLPDNQITHGKDKGPFRELSGDPGAHKEQHDGEPREIEPSDGKL